MNDQEPKLERSLKAFLRWEQRKRLELNLAALACYALAAAILILFLVALFGAGFSPWVAIGFGLLFGALVVFKQRWRAQDRIRALVQLDKALHLDERAVTAWEALRGGETTAARQLVIEQASEKLSAFEPRLAFPRRWSWQAYSVLPLLGLWLLLVWLDVSASTGSRLHEPQTLAHRVKAFARELQEKAKSEGLKESLQAGKELEKLAQQGIDKQNSDAQMKKELAGAAQKIAAAGKQAAKDAAMNAAQSEQSLRELKAELEAARDLFGDGTGAREQEGSWLDRLAALPQLKRQLDKEEKGGGGMGQKEMKSLLDKMEKQVAGELDRRALLDAEQFLQQPMKQGQSQQGEANARAPGREQQSSAGDPEDGEKGRNPSNRPGSEPGKKSDDKESLPQFPVGPSTQVKGTIGAGESSGVVFKGKPTPGKSTLSQDEIVASYRRQAEQDLNSERVPEALKETIRNYFMSLGEGKK
ncbi:MAG: hypothetical protein FJ145_12390 [Deltaproteobacteria bacterium]|nr:hypothetical protein [Deltaproteobacteria bacterium]